MRNHIPLSFVLSILLLTGGVSNLHALSTIEYTVDANTIALYHFNSSSGGIVTDEVGNHNGTLQDDATITTGSGGYFGEGLLLDGSGDYVRLGNVHKTPIRDTSLGTVELWVKLQSAPSYFVVLGSGSEYGGNWDDGFFLGRHWNYGQNLMFGVWGPGWKFAHSSIDPADLVGSWHHIAGTWGPEGVELWLDGNLIATNSYTGSLPNPNYATVLIGTDSWRWHTPGVIDEVRISDIQRDFSTTPFPTELDEFVDGIFGLTGESSENGVQNVDSGLFSQANDEVTIQFSAPSDMFGKLQAIRFFVQGTAPSDATFRLRVYDKSEDSEPGILLRETTSMIQSGSSGFTPFQQGVVDVDISPNQTFFTGISFISANNPNIGVDNVPSTYRSKNWLRDASEQVWRPADSDVQKTLTDASLMIEAIAGIKGDIDRSSAVTLGDATQAIDRVLGRIEFTIYQEFEADYNNDSQVNLGDVTKIVDEFLGNI